MKIIKMMMRMKTSIMMMKILMTTRMKTSMTTIQRKTKWRMKILTWAIRR